MEINLIAFVVALLGSGGIGLAIRELANVVTLARNGVSGKEKDRVSDIVRARELAQAREARALAREDRERGWRIDLQEYSARLARALIMAGQEPPAEPAEPPPVVTGEIPKQ